MSIILLSKTMNTSEKFLSQFLTGPCSVFLTEVSYSDDGEMQKRMGVYREQYPDGSEFLHSEHELAPILTNKNLREIVVIDSLNLWISNLTLLYNSDERSIWVVWDRMKADLEALLRGMKSQTCIILGSNVDFDWSVRTPVARIYQRLSWEIDNFIIPRIDKYGLLMNGSVLWLK